jgi:hypothetical protein
VASLAPEAELLNQRRLASANSFCKCFVYAFGQGGRFEAANCFKTLVGRNGLRPLLARNRARFASAMWAACLALRVLRPVGPLLIVHG